VGKYRTHSCGALNKEHIGKDITISGWVRRRRDHGGLIFIELADYSGSCQVVFKPEFGNSFSIGETLRSEYVVQLTGKLCLRPDGTINPEMETGEVELEVSQATILSRSETPPFSIQDKTDAKEELRLRYRYLDLRRPEMQEKLRLRHRIYKAARSFLDQEGFCEVETPVLTKPTPEGARDFLVPSRINQGEFYALPQSPQLFKQVLMCACLDRYFQIVKCFRDEDLRANRQPEFTQIDIEMSFVQESDVQELVEKLVSKIWQEAAGIKIQLPLPRISYDEAMSRFGVDAPDMRFGLELKELNEVFQNIEFQVFRDTLSLGGMIKGLNAKAASHFSRKELDDLTENAKKLGAKGLVWFKVEDGSLKSPISKFLTPDMEKNLINALELESGDLALIIADQKTVCNSVLGSLRIHVAKILDLIDPRKLSFLWVERFPLFEHSPELGRYLSVHHPFTSPLFIDEDNTTELDGDLAELKARAYDIVLNGQEIGGGSIRIHRSDIQSKVFKLLGISEQEAKEKFGFLLDALSFGAPPHGGIALGLDRIAMIISGAESIRDVIAFPKTQRGQDLMVSAPTVASIEQLMELGIRVQQKKQD
jgi:aspartyl-tRNA synthetase